MEGRRGHKPLSCPLHLGAEVFLWIPEERRGGREEFEGGGEDGIARAVTIFPIISAGGRIY